MGAQNFGITYIQKNRLNNVGLTRKVNEELETHPREQAAARTKIAKGSAGDWQ